jgi:hypothetical protein
MLIGYAVARSSLYGTQTKPILLSYQIYSKKWMEVGSEQPSPAKNQNNNARDKANLEHVSTNL